MHHRQGKEREKQQIRSVKGKRKIINKKIKDYQTLLDKVKLKNKTWCLFQLTYLFILKKEGFKK